MQFEDEITPNGWTTTYQSLMRVEPKTKSITTGQKGEKKTSEKLLNPRVFKRSLTTSVVKILKDIPPEVIAGVDNISLHKKATTLDITKDSEVVKKLKEANLSFKTKTIKFEPVDEWKSKIIETETIKAITSPFTSAGEPVEQKIKTDYTHLLKYDFTGFSNWEILARKREIAYAYAVRKLILGEASPIDFEKVKVRFVITLDGDNNKKIILNESKDTYDLIVELDNLDETGPEKDITDVGVGQATGISVTLDAISKIDFKLNEEIQKQDMGSTNLRKVSNAGVDTEKLTYLREGNVLIKEITVPLFVRKFFFGLNTKDATGESQEAIVITNSSKMHTFKHLSIPKKMLKSDKDGNPIVDHKAIVKDLCTYFNEYLEPLKPKGKVWDVKTNKWIDKADAKQGLDNTTYYK